MDKTENHTYGPRTPVSNPTLQVTDSYDRERESTAMSHPASTPYATHQQLVIAGLQKEDTGMVSEHGHSLTKIKPMTKHSGQSVSTFFNGLFQTIIAIGTLGTSVTFSYVVSNKTNIPDTTAFYDPSHVQIFLAVSWLLFLLSLAFASLGSTLLTFFKAHWARDWDGEHGRRSQIEVQLYAVLASALMGGLVIGAFVFMCLVVVAYTPAVGWIALGFTAWFGIIIAACVVYQLPWPCKKVPVAPGKQSFTP